MIRCILIVISCSISLSASAETDVWKDDVGGWHIGIDETLDGCYMLKIFEGNTWLIVGFDPDDSKLYLIVGDSDWRSIETGKIYSLDIQFGQRSPWSVNATGFEGDNGDNSLYYGFENATREQFTLFIDELQRMQNVSFMYEGERIANLSLRGSYRATEELINCQNHLFDQEKFDDPFQNVSNDPFS